MFPVPPGKSLSRVMILFVTAGAVLVTSIPSQAQEVRQRRTLFDYLFGGPKRQQPDIFELPTRKKPRIKKRNTQSITSLETASPPVTKNADARHILVVGDFLATGLAQGLTAAFAQDPSTVIDSRSNNASGLVRSDFYDWQQKLPAFIGELRPSAVVIMIGANDRQQLRLPEGKVDFDTPAWNEAYSGRVASIQKLVKDAGVPLIWVGLPSFKSTNNNTAALQFNVVYRNEAARAGAEFVDIWDGFVDENGKFVQSGSDFNGQPARLRTSDGVGLAAAGKRKLAFYTEKPIRKILGEPLSVESLIREDEKLMAGTKTDKPAGPPVRTAPIGLGDPELDGGGDLLGAPGSAVASAASLEIGLAPAPVGRVDNFSLSGL